MSAAIEGPTGTILTGLLKINGEPVTLCHQFCDRPDGVMCGRPANHPDDSFGHVCADCANAWAGNGSRPK